MASSVIGKDLVITSHTYTVTVPANSWSGAPAGKPFTEADAPDSGNYEFIGGCASIDHSYATATYNYGDGYGWVINNHSEVQTFNVIVTRMYRKK